MSTDFESSAIDTALVKRLIASQFPQWADLPVRPVAVGGWDNRTFHLGDTMSVRLPSAEGYVLQVQKEQRWLPQLAPHLPLPIPVPLGLGVPGKGFPWLWSVYGWLEGETAAVERIGDLTEFAGDLAHFLNALYRIDTADTGDELRPGPHNFYRGGSLGAYDDETRQVLDALKDDIDTDAARAVWDEALATTWQGAPVWFHGDVASGNLLVREGRLSAVIDFGIMGVGDPACDLAIGWTLFEGESREVFRAALPFDVGTWARGRGWTLWKALITLEDHRHGTLEKSAEKAAEARRVIAEVLADPIRPT